MIDRVFLSLSIYMCIYNMYMHACTYSVQCLLILPCHAGCSIDLTINMSQLTAIELNIYECLLNYQFMSAHACIHATSMLLITLHKPHTTDRFLNYIYIYINACLVHAREHVYMQLTSHHRLPACGAACIRKSRTRCCRCRACTCSGC